MTDRPRRFFFVHLQKTAGTVMRQRMARSLGESAIYPNESDGTNVYEVVVSVDHLRERFRARAAEVQVVTGHFPLCAMSLLDGEFTSFTVLREPVERTLSYLRHHRERIAEDRHKSLEEIYEDPFRFHGFVHNHMVKMFSLTVDEMDAGMLTLVEFTPDHLERAKQNLAGVDAVGFQESLDEFCNELNGRFGWSLGEPPFANRTEATAVDPSFRRRIAEDNALDVAFYEHARVAWSAPSDKNH